MRRHAQRIFQQNQSRPVSGRARHSRIAGEGSLLRKRVFDRASPGPRRHASARMAVGSFMVVIFFVVVGVAFDAAAQSSSLYVTEPAQAAQVQRRADGIPGNRISPEVARLSLVAVQLPEPRKFAMHDLVTIIVRESVQSDSRAKLDSNKGIELTGAIAQFPNLQVKDLLEFQLGQSDLNKGKPELDLKFENEFEGKASYNRRDSFITRITAEIIDIKPNGNLVLEARKYIQSDKESLKMILSGVCRSDDISAYNTVLSTELFDLRLVKKHGGELRKATKKGLVTKLFEFIFNF